MRTGGTKRLLFYNWAQFDDPNRLGGGVSVYLRNLLDELSQRADLEIWFLSAGVRASLTDRRVHCIETSNEFAGRGVKSFTMVNSPVRAPAMAMFHKIDLCRTDTLSRDAFQSFLDAHGPFDAVHIHNLEGISSKVLELAPSYSRTRFVYTWHNYIPLCPQVHLLFQDRQPCDDFGDGGKCAACIAPPLHRRQTPPAASYRLWRETNLRLLNSEFHCTIAVSDLAKRTVVGLGAHPEAVRVVPLGMDGHATPGEMKACWNAKPARDRFTFSFVGYGATYKGLPFLAEAVERAPQGMFKQDADLIVAARLGRRERALLKRLGRVFHKVTHINGFERHDLPDIAGATDVNIVPSIWPETFNQVGYELLCAGTPSLLSSTVGLRMFYENKPGFEFVAGDHDDLVEKMTALMRHRDKVAAFWDTPVRLPTMQEHADAVLEIMMGGGSVRSGDRKRVGGALEE